jgi:hypothetical protein
MSNDANKSTTLAHSFPGCYRLTGCRAHSADQRTLVPVAVAAAGLHVYHNVYQVLAFGCTGLHVIKH